MRSIGSCQSGRGSHPCLLDVSGMAPKWSPRKNYIVKLRVHLVSGDRKEMDRSRILENNYGTKFSRWMGP
jgi:hypothetical protein